MELLKDKMILELRNLDEISKKENVCEALKVKLNADVDGFK